jgi:hypothetical protein
MSVCIHSRSCGILTDDAHEKLVAVKLTKNRDGTVAPNPLNISLSFIKAQWNIISSGFAICKTL